MHNWSIYKNHFATTDMENIWSEQNTIKGWLETEQAIACCQANLSIIPASASKSISEVSIENLDLEQLAHDMKIAGRPIVGLIKQIKTLVGNDFADSVHYGTTTQDILDTTMVVQMSCGLQLIQNTIDAIITQLVELEKQHADTLMIGRTNNQYALPIKFSTKLNLWQQELNRRQSAITDAKKRGLLVQLGGPVGDLSAYGEKGLALKMSLADHFKIGFSESHWQNSRDGISEIISSLGLLNSTLVKIAHNINLLSSSDIAELRERPSKGKGASSSMAHKQNQRCSEFAEAIARLARQSAEQINETTLHQHERSGNVWISEWVIVPNVFLFSSAALSWTEKLFDNLEIDVTRMNLNLQKSINQGHGA